MTDADQIPDKVVEAASDAFKRAFLLGRKDAMREAMKAGLGVWQGAVYRPPFLPNYLILPLPQKDGDA